MFEEASIHDMETIHIVTATNNAYAEHLAVMLHSLLVNKVSNCVWQVKSAEFGSHFVHIALPNINFL